MDNESCALNIICSRQGGILESEATDIACKTMSQTHWFNTLHNLIQIGIVKRIGKGDLCLLRSVQNVPQLHLTGHQLVVHRIIDMVGPKGITEDEIISMLSGKNQPHKKDIRKALKSLFQFGHVQKIRSIQNRKEMMYIVAGIEPEKSLTGGRWYTTEKEFDTAYVNKLRQTCICFLDQHQENETLSASVVHRWIISRSESFQSPTMDEISQILFTLELDGVIEEVHTSSIEQHGKGPAYTRPTRPNTNTEYKPRSKKVGASLFEAPCTSCQYLHECDPCCLGLISPVSTCGSIRCPYIEEWLA